MRWRSSPVRSCERKTERVRVPARCHRYRLLRTRPKLHVELHYLALAPHRDTDDIPNAVFRLEDHSELLPCTNRLPSDREDVIRPQRNPQITESPQAIGSANARLRGGAAAERFGDKMPPPPGVRTPLRFRRAARFLLTSMSATPNQGCA